jgi:hypothetical protein
MMHLFDAPATSLSLSQTNSDIWFGYMHVMHRHRRLLNWKRIFSPAYYYEVGTSGNALKCHIISAGLCLNYLQTSLFIPIQTAVGIISPVESANEAFHVHYKLWENHDLTVQPVITYIYLCGLIYAYCLSYFSNHSSVWTRNQSEM